MHGENVPKSNKNQATMGFAASNVCTVLHIQEKI